MGNVDYELKDFVQEYYNPLLDSTYRQRFYSEDVKRDRNPFQRDYSRILYSSSFRRLQGKMQLLGLQKEKFYRNRLTHSLEVSQIARGIAERIRECSGCKHIYNEDIYVVEAGSLAHDIGNPPFGHHGERILNELIINQGGFEGNAQTLRVLNKIEQKLPKERGLNLTKRTLLSVVKYFNKNDKSKFIYDEDYKWIKSLTDSGEIKPRTIDVQIVDLADEIAYGAHDLEDALSLNLFNIDEFLYEFKKEASPFSYEALDKLVDQSKKVADKALVHSSSEEFSFLFRKELISNIVDKLINDITVTKVNAEFKEDTGTRNNSELDFSKYGDFAIKLKKLTFDSINRSNVVQIYEKQGEKVIKGLFDAFMDDSFNKDNKLLPIEYRDLERDSKARLIVDYISGMMDSFAIKTFEEIYGSNSLNKLYNPSYFKDYTN